jgi:hypothetical protein
MTQPLLLRDGDKFSCLVTHVWPVEDLDSALDLSGGLLFYPGMPFQLDEFWRKSLGTIGLAMLEGVNFCLILSKQSANPGTLDGENEELFRRVQWAFECVMLSGIPETRAVSVMAGAWVNGHADLRSHGTGQSYFHTPYSRRAPVTKEAVHSGGCAFRAIESIYADESGFTRLKDGYFALTRVMREDEPSFRLHQCVRSIEALTKTDDAVNFAKRSRELSELLAKQVPMEELKEAYAMRSSAEHMNLITAPFLSLGMTADDRLKRAGERTGMIEDFALACYRSVLTVPGLAPHFKDDRTIKAFWTMSYGEKEQAWKGA